jgi:cell division protein FtsB
LWTVSLHFTPWFWVVCLIMGAGFVVWSWSGENGFRTARRFQEQRAALERENEIIKQSNERLKQEIRLVQQDPSFLEWIAKERLGMIGENERMYVFQK